MDRDTSRTAQREQELIEELSLMDDIFMNVCFGAEGGKGCAELLIRIVLERDDLWIKELRTQHSLMNLQGRGVIFDIYAEDAEGRSYDIEIQKDERGALSRRARYHASLMDANVSERGAEHRELREIYVIFITEEDIYKRGYPLYHVERKIEETGESFGDGAHIIYVNGEYRGEDAIGRLMHDLSCADPEEMNYEILSEQTRRFKGRDKEGRKMSSRLLEEWKSEIIREYKDTVEKERLEQAEKEQNIRMARRLLSLGKLSDEEIAASTFLSDEEIRELKNEELLCS